MGLQVFRKLSIVRSLVGAEEPSSLGAEADGRTILFDRNRENSDIVLIDLPTE
jgi:hypothetical protein